MKSNITIMKMTDAYEYQSFYNLRENLIEIDCRDIEGTRCYLDDEAKAELLKRMDNVSGKVELSKSINSVDADAELSKSMDSVDAEGIHFIDSGNYHYLSLLWLSKINEDFNLILFDHHPDDQPPSFGQITSCGGWVLEAKETLSHLKNVYTFGVNEVHDPDRVYCYEANEAIALGQDSHASNNTFKDISEIPTDLPLYISIDKDVLSTDDAITDWDQGDMSLEEMIELLSELVKDRRILGVDICGDSGEMAESGARINNQTNELLFDFLSENS